MGEVEQLLLQIIAMKWEAYTQAASVVEEGAVSVAALRAMKIEALQAQLELARYREEKNGG